MLEDRKLNGQFRIALGTAGAEARACAAAVLMTMLAGWEECSPSHNVYSWILVLE